MLFRPRLDCMDWSVACSFLLLIYFVRLLKENFASGEIQSLIVSPTNSQVIEGQNVVLYCQVSNQVGYVQWSKNGLLLGFDPEIPGFPRYTIVGNTSIGIYNLKITDVKLEDNAEFECQVGPGEGQDLIVAKAFVTVLLQPTSIEIVGRSNGSEAQVKATESISLECVVKGGKPAPDIVWYRNSFRLSDEQSTESTSDENDGRQVIKSTLSIKPNPDDNQARYTCEASTSFSSQKLKTFVILNVLYPPNKPVIEGYRTNERIRAGESVTLKCISRGGNPLARLVWTKNGEFIDHSYTTSDNEATNDISFTAGASDDGAVYTCWASNIMTPEPFDKSVTLQVLYAPESVTVTAPKEAKPGDVITASCKTERSNPASEVTWVIDGRPVMTESEVVLDANGGWITSSKITVNITEQDRNTKMFTCYAVNQDLGETITKSYTVSILYAPDPPAIFGYVEGTAIHAGKLQRFTCISHGGNPLPELKWFKGDEELPVSQSSTTGTIISKELTIIATATDNGAEYKCKSTSKALAQPLVTSITLTVYFPPTLPTIKIKPKKPKAGSQIRLTCECSSSNPAANITWWSSSIKEELLGPPVNSVSAAGDNKGFVTKSVLLINVTAQNDGSKFICQATNEAIQQSSHDAILLSVTYKPVFKISDKSVFEVKENESSIIDITASGNPRNISYTWNRDNETIWEGSVFNITSAVRSLTGTYLCTASNDVGESSIKIILKVLYPMAISKGGEDSEKVVIAEPNSNVKLECTANGYPLPDNAITWARDNFNMQDRTEVIASVSGKSILLVKNVTKDISGAFICQANNGVGSSDTWKIIILVKHEPIIKELDSYKAVLSDRKKSTQLQCKAEGVPDVVFSWSFEGVIVSNKNSRIKHETSKLDHYIWKSLLTIEGVNVKDFGEYKCVARNEIGFDTAEINLIPDSAPDPPALVKVTNITKNSIFIVWVPGFSGGHNQTHRVRFKSLKDPAASYIDVHPPATNSVWVRNLKPETEYEVAMMSFNTKGSSPYTTDKIKVKTLGLSDSAYKTTSGDLSFNGSLIEMLVASLGTVFLLLLMFNIVLLAMYYRKKKPKAKTKRKYSGDYTYSSSDISISSKVESEETTFSSYSSEPRESTDKFSSYSSHSISKKSETNMSSYESESEYFSEDFSSVSLSQPYSSSKFI